MGWLEFLAWLRATNRRRSGATDSDPGSWDDPVSKSNVADFDAERRRLRGY